MIKNIEIKIIVNQDKKMKVVPKSNAEILKQFQSILDKPDQYHTIQVRKTTDFKALKLALKRKYKDQIEILNGVSGGCYGARDGKQYEGLTVWCSPDLFPERYLDDQGDEIVNLHKIVNNYGALVEGLDGEKLLDIFEDLGIESKRDNTYNYMGHDEYSCNSMFDADFSIIETEKTTILVIKWHCGGDIRGNYTDLEVYKFESIDDLYSALQPTQELKEEVD